MEEKQLLILCPQHTLAVMCMQTDNRLISLYDLSLLYFIRIR